MSSVFAMPEFVQAAASNLADIGSNISEARSAAAPGTIGVVAAAEDDVSQAIAALFGQHAQAFQTLSAQAQAFHQDFVQLMSGAAGKYSATEAASTNLLSGLAATTPSPAGFVTAVELVAESPILSPIVSPLNTATQALTGGC